MNSRPLIASLVIGSFLSASVSSAFAQVRPMGPAIPPPSPAAPPPPPPPGPPPSPYAPYGQQPYQQYPAPQPPPSAVAPNGEYVAPLSQTTQPTYVPQSVALSGPRFIKDWEEGQPIPYGYHHETRVRKGLVISGSILLGVTYIYSSLLAAAGEDASDGGHNTLGWLWMPVLGPFFEMSETDSTAARYVLFLDGMAQAAGLTMLIAGALYPKHILVRNDLASMSFVPMKIGSDGSGMGVVGRF